MDSSVENPIENVSNPENVDLSSQVFETFKEAMIEENLPLQIQTIQRLKPLAQALGERATREELLPFIEENMDLHDEILFNLSESLNNFIPLVGGIEHSKIIFDILTKLCVTDEILVREKSVEALRSFAEKLTGEQVEKFLYPVLCKLVSDDWFTSKCSALMLYSTVYPKLSDEKKEDLRNRFRTLIQDDSPMVRKAAALSCIDFMRCLEGDYIKNEFIPIFCDIALDPMDSVRSVTIDIALALADLLNADDIDESIIKIIEQASEDPSWRVREQLAESLPKLQQKVTHPKYRGKLVAIFQKLTKDSEAEVRRLAALNLYEFSKGLQDSYKTFGQFEDNFEPVFEQSILPAMERLLLDESDYVRLALSSSVLRLSSLLSENSFKKYILPLLLEVIEREDSMVIQANFLQSLSNVSKGTDLTSSLSSIKNAVKNVIVRSQSSWRSRRDILMTFVDVAKFCSAKYFSDHFKMYYAALLGDSVFAVRRNAAVILPLLAKQYGAKWAFENLLPYFMMFTKDARYLYRFVPLFGINELLYPSLGVKSYKYLDSLKEIIKDPQNVNNKLGLICLFKIVKVAEKISQKLKSEEFNEISEIENDLNYLSCDINTYIERDFDVYIEKYKDLDFYSIQKEDLAEDNYTYLQGVLYLIYKKFLQVLANLNKDGTVNIKTKAIYTLTTISKYLDSINKELSNSWVQQSLERISKEDMKKIEAELEIELQQENDSDLIDTNLMEAALTDDSKVPDLSKSILVENTSVKLVVTAEVNQNVDKESNSSSNITLVDEVLDILNKKLATKDSTDENFRN